MPLTPPVFCIPTINAPQCGATFAKWHRMGYLTAALIDGSTPQPDDCDLCVHVDEYRGWPAATNELLHRALINWPQSQWFIAGGDDIDPDTRLRAEDIALQCEFHFHGTMGVMQPTGDRWDTDASGRSASERICGSPWLGRDFVLRWKGPFEERFWHMFADELLKRQTEACGLLWQCRDFTHFHRHPARMKTMTPAYMQRNNSHWESDKATFREIEKSGFPNDVRFYTI